jgi:hypothetical protein
MTPWQLRARVLAALGTLAASVCLLSPVAQSSAKEESAPEATLGTIEKLTEFIFDTRLNTSALTQALTYRDRGYSFRTFEEVWNYNISSAYALRGTAQTFRLDSRPSESPYWWSVEFPEGATDFIWNLAAELEPELQRVSGLRPADHRPPLEKAIIGRNLFQTFSLVHRAGEVTQDPRARSAALQIEHLVAALFSSMRLTEAEYRQLCALRPTRLPRGFTSHASYSLAGNYLPEQIVRNDPSWISIAGDGTWTRHFREYDGRAFVHVFIRASSMDGRQLEILRRELHALYGEHLHRVAVDQDVPNGLETLLVRSLGVFLTDGTYRDSLWPEEVLIRQFKYPRSQIDNTTSDFRGTLFFQYRMSEQLLLRNPASLGLRRIRDDDAQYFGFFGDVPDIHHSYSDTVTTMRSNCIACHSELFYGLSTIFSFERDPRTTNAPAADDSIAMLVSPGRYRLRTSAYRQLESLVQAIR